MTQSKHFNVPGLTELENAILKEDPLNMVSFLQVKYSNNCSISQQLNQYIDVNNLEQEQFQLHKFLHHFHS